MGNAHLHLPPSTTMSGNFETLSPSLSLSFRLFLACLFYYFQVASGIGRFADRRYHRFEKKGERRVLNFPSIEGIKKNGPQSAAQFQPFNPPPLSSPTSASPPASGKLRARGKSSSCVVAVSYEIMKRPTTRGRNFWLLSSQAGCLALCFASVRRIIVTFDRQSLQVSRNWTRGSEFLRGREKWLNGVENILKRSSRWSSFAQ